MTTPHRRLAFIAALLVFRLAQAPALLRADVPLELTRVGDPIWRPTDSHLFTAACEPASAFGVVADQIAPFNAPPRDPPFDDILSERIAAAGFQDASTFVPSDIDGAPSGIYFGHLLIPDPGATGSSRDFPSGRIIPNRLFPIRGDTDILRNGVVVDGELDGAFPPAVGFDGKSHDVALFCDDAVFFPPGTELTGNYAYRSILRDREGNGWDIVAPFQVVNLLGDYNGNNLVEQADLDLVLLNWGEATPPVPEDWSFDLPSGAIDQEELDRVLLNWGERFPAASPRPAATGSAGVPEPHAVALALLACGALMLRRRAVWRRRCCAGFLRCVFVFSAPWWVAGWPAMAANDFWKMAESGGWDTNSRWLDGRTPGIFDSATFNRPGTYVVTFPVSPTPIQALTVAAANVTFGITSTAPMVSTLRVTSPIAGASHDVLLVGGATLTLGRGVALPLHLMVGDGVSLQSGATLNVKFGSQAVSERITVGDIDTTIGILNITDGGRVQSNSSAMVASGSVTVSGTNSLWDTGVLNVGSSSPFADTSLRSTLTISGAGRVQSRSGIVGTARGEATAVVSGAGSVWNTGRLLVGGDGSFASGNGSGRLDIQPGGAVVVSQKTELFTGGRLRLQGGAFDTGEMFVQRGQFEWTSGTFRVGTYHGDLVNQTGTLAPGHSAGSTTIVGNYTQQSPGVLDIEIGGPAQGTEYDVVNVTGTAMLGGQMNVSLINGFAPTASETFVVLNTENDLQGAFTNAANGQRLNTLDGLGSFRVHYGAGSEFAPNLVVLNEFGGPGHDSLINGVSLFYNNSAFDKNGSAVTAADFAAIATDKSSLSAGNKGTFANISGYSRGINGIFVDATGLPNDGAGIDASDFTFRMGNDNTADAWVTAPAPTAVDVLPGAGENSADRIFVTFADGAVKNTWLRMSIEANADTGLASNADFFFGNAAGETGAGFLPGVVGVDAADLQRIAQELTPLAQSGTELITQGADLNRDRTVNAFDFQVVAANLRPNVIALITPQVAAGVALAAPVPEPATLLVAGLAVVGSTAGFARRSRRSAA